VTTAAQPNAGAEVSLGNVTVDLKVLVQRKNVACTLTFRGTKVNIVFGPDGVAEVLLPPGAHPQIGELAPGM
jgi:hypothetical protein